MQKTPPNQQSYRRLFLFTITLPLLILGYGKEDLSVYDVELEELESRYFNYQDNAIVIEYSEVKNVLISVDESSLMVEDVGLFENISQDSVIVSSPDNPHEECLLRKVESLNRQEGSINIETQPPTLYEAFNRTLQISMVFLAVSTKNHYAC